MKEYTDTAGLVFADFFLRIKGDDETKKTLEANDFMLALMTGKDLKGEWKLETSENYIEMGKIAQALNKLDELIN